MGSKSGRSGHARRLITQRPRPFAHEVLAVEEPPALERRERRGRIQHRRHGGHAGDRLGRARVGRDPQHEIAAERKTAQEEPRRRKALRNRPRRADDLGQPAGMKDAAVEVVALAVIAQIEPQNVEPVVEEQCTERDDVTRFRVAFPAVQHDRDAVQGGSSGVSRAAADLPGPRARLRNPCSRTPSPQSSTHCRALVSSIAPRRRANHGRGGRLPRAVCSWPLRSKRGGENA